MKNSFIISKKLILLLLALSFLSAGNGYLAANSKTFGGSSQLLYSSPEYICATACIAEGHQSAKVTRPDPEDSFILPQRTVSLNCFWIAQSRLLGLPDSVILSCIPETLSIRAPPFSTTEHS
ncbi:hypothetical protein SAMN02745702_01594 [Desulfobaculum bizertense DSM 18034]|uniref:Uncharacterized protein n=1 Tax=Desulfobaculum bizertense DSM 18034 TaxID=1121442 RepID=A0A1T4W4L9_9BACT|nr:hypothetical protein SAMN02745702_01594 [Desulfobaculum bizertense DSM 18034]